MADWVDVMLLILIILTALTEDLYSKGSVNCIPKYNQIRCQLFECLSDQFSRFLCFISGTAIKPLQTEA
jgi:hypothetical protein